MMFMVNNLIGFGAVSGAAFAVQAVTFDGSTDYLTRGADLTGNADGKLGIISCWVKFNAGDNATQYILEGEGGYYRLTRQSDNTLIVNATSPGGAGVLNMASSSTYTTASGWIHVLASWDLGNTTGNLYIDGVDDLAGSPTLTNSDIDYTRANFTIGRYNVGSSDYLNADIAELYFNNAEYLDISSSANRALFSNGKPVDLGTDGSTPTGTAPRVYLSCRIGDAASAFVTNRGTGGGLTDNGSIALAATSPSD